MDIKLEISKKAGLINKAVKFDDVPCRSGSCNLVFYRCEILPSNAGSFRLVKHIRESKNKKPCNISNKNTAPHFFCLLPLQIREKQKKICKQVATYVSFYHLFIAPTLSPFFFLACRIDQEIPPNPALFDDYIDRNPVNRSVQVSGDMSENEVEGEIWSCYRLLPPFAVFNEQFQDSVPNNEILILFPTWHFPVRSVLRRLPQFDTAWTF